MRTKTTLPITQARKNIFDIAEKVQKKEKYFTLTERGVPKAVILSAQEFESLTEKKCGGAVLADGSFRKYSSSPQVFAKTLIIRDESRVVYLSENDHDYRQQEESLIKAQLYVELIENYRYPLWLVEFGRYVKVGPKESRRYIEADVIVNNENGNAKLIFEVGSFANFKEGIDRVVSDLFDVANSMSWVKKPDYIIYYSREHRKKENKKEKILAVDCNKFNTFYAWKRAGRPSTDKIPMFKV